MKMYILDIISSWLQISVPPIKGTDMSAWAWKVWTSLDIIWIDSSVGGVLRISPIKIDLFFKLAYVVRMVCHRLKQKLNVVFNWHGTCLIITTFIGTIYP